MIGSPVYPCCQTNHAKHIVLDQGLPFSSTSKPFRNGLTRFENTYTAFGGWASKKSRRCCPSRNWILANMITLSVATSNAFSTNSLAKENGGFVMMLLNFSG